MHTNFRFRHHLARWATFEHLESRINPSGPPAPCLLEPPTQGDAARATQAVNCFGIDLYEQLQHEKGNLFFSPLSVTTALAMTYAGAAGQTAAEMENVLHLGTAPGIHESFAALISSLDKSQNVADGFQLELANSIWPRTGLAVKDDFVHTIQQDYQGAVQSLDYSHPHQATQIINSWVDEKTHGTINKIFDVDLAPTSIMTLVNSIFFQAHWATAFDPSLTNTDGVFYRENGDAVHATMMYTMMSVPYTSATGFQMLEMPLEGGRTSMVLVLPDRADTNELTPELLVQINNWLASPRGEDTVDVTLPKFNTAVCTSLEDLLGDMGMPLAFSEDADFSKMTAVGAMFNLVIHKAFLEVTEQGTKASAATGVGDACFAAGTLVLTPDGEKPIEQLKAGDYVMSRNEFDLAGEIQPKLIEASFHGQGELVHLHIGGQIIRPTKEHRFFVKDRGWTSAGELRSGDLLATDLCSWLEVENISASGVVAPIYNIRVTDHHTYFVGGPTWGFAVWTHNRCRPSFLADHPFHVLIRDNTTSALLFMGRINDPSQSENTLDPSITTQQHPLGDADGDRDVDANDLLSLLDNWTGALDVNTGGKNQLNGDLDGDADTDSADLLMLLSNWTGSKNAALARTLSMLADGGGAQDSSSPPSTAAAFSDTSDEPSDSSLIPRLVDGAFDNTRLAAA